MTISKLPEHIFVLATSHALRIMALSTSISLLSHVNPLPIGEISKLPSFGALRNSPYFHLPLKNCSISTFIPYPQARIATPRAAVVLPLPSPVLTMIKPFFLVAPAPARVIVFFIGPSAYRNALGCSFFANSSMASKTRKLEFSNRYSRDITRLSQLASNWFHPTPPLF